ncbi:MAG: hypothetical protein HFH36_07305 [Lachnospiraceae bacterium]|nr:hypothetical protein [Lachnospiraceae bacterium]
MKENIAKLRLDLVLLGVRAVTIVFWLYILWMSIEVRLSLQIFLMMVIFLSDALDGVISRKFCLPSQQYRFRILDAVVDKIGILAFLMMLLYLGRIGLDVLWMIVGYNVLLLVFPFFYILGRRSQNIAWIQATLFSRLYAASVGVYCFFSIISDSGLKYGKEWFVYFLIAGVVSLSSHIIKVKKVKGAL